MFINFYPTFKEYLFFSSTWNIYKCKYQRSIIIQTCMTAK